MFEVATRSTNFEDLDIPGIVQYSQGEIMGVLQVDLLHVRCAKIIQQRQTELPCHFQAFNIAKREFF